MPAETLETALSANRRSPDMEDYLDIARRHKTWIAGPLFAGLVLSVVTAFLWPDTFISTAVIRVVPPQVPESLVQQNVNLEMSQRINSMAQQILSRSTLTDVINTYGLYPRERERLPMEDVVEAMRRDDVRISNVVNFAAAREDRRTVPAFQISVFYGNRNLAQKVCDHLAGRFIDESIRNTLAISNGTTQFLRDQLEQERRKLEAAEDRLAAFRVKNAGRLPDQAAQNLQQANALETRAANLNGTISRLNQERLLADSELRVTRDRLAQLKATPEPHAPTAAPAARSERLATLEAEIARQEALLSGLKQHYRDTHPDVERAQASLDAVKRNLEALEKREAARRPAEPAAPKQTQTNPLLAEKQAEYEAAVTRLIGAIAAKDLEMADARRQLAAVEVQIAGVQSRLEASPLNEKEYTDLTRERDMIRARVEGLDKNLASSHTAEAINERQQGERLEILDAATLPVKPARPDRGVIIAVGTAAGLLLGLLLAGTRELKDTSLKNLKDVRAYTLLQILGSVPLLENDLIVRRRRRLAWLAWSTAFIVGIGMMSASMYFYYFTPRM